MSKLFQNPLREWKDYEDMLQVLKQEKGPIQISGCVDSQKVHLVDALDADCSFKLVVTYSEQQAKKIYEDFKFFTKNVMLYPAKDLIFYNADIQGNLIVKQRLKVLENMKKRQGGVVVTTIDALMNSLPAFDTIEQHIISLEIEQQIDIENLKENFVFLGYERVVRVEEAGQFAVRGGIIDIFSMTEENPCRVELWGDQIDSIRFFDAESQRSIDSNEEKVEIFPATELILTEERKQKGMERIKKQFQTYYKKLEKDKKSEEASRIREGIEMVLDELDSGIRTMGLDSYISFFYEDRESFLDYFPQSDTLICLDEPIRLKERSDAVELEFRESMAGRLTKGYILPGQTEILYSAKQTFARIQKKNAVLIHGLEQKVPMLKVNYSYNLSVRTMNSYKDSFDLLIKDLTEWKKKGIRVALLCGSKTRAQRLSDNLREYDLLAYASEEKEKEILPGEILVTSGSLHKGFLYVDLGFIVITDGDIFGEKKRKKKKNPQKGQGIHDFSELTIGDYVIHEDHGMGIYKGISKVEMDRISKDYLKIEYGDGGNLYIPVTQLNLLQKYASSDVKHPKLNKLGGQEWTKTKSKVKKAVREVAKELVDLYAVRENSRGYSYGKDTVWQREFEELFPYEETSDQLDAIEAVKEDMESNKIMDRLICGDVGYGKTEIAIRAAFKAVQESKQVVYLVPTTILAQQHYNTFVQRMKDFPIHIELLSRFRTPAQIKQSLENLRKGLIDIVIGTHRVLSKDVIFKDLGLLIIDEEQRFGVTHKEKIKQLKKTVDVMTLTATPIPRTLHMSLIGIRDMSVLEEAPNERQPIQTYVMEYNSEMVREAINRELARDGQVYYVYNQVKDIEEMTGKVAKLVPDAVVAYAHGQMNKRQLERIMLDFVNGEIDVLISTTIIETGLDIPNVNTIVIHNADHFGLSQLYQLRGRVGRSNRTSYAFIMYKKDKVLREEAEKRLQAIREFTELGSGIKIAMRDLEIRGAGSLLGEKQHGHMEAVGYDLYCKMLNHAVRTLKGEITEEESFETTIDLQIDAYIPDFYIRNEYMKLDIYKRIASIEAEEDYTEIQDELFDRFGNIPKPVENLLQIALIRSTAHQIYITELRGNNQEIKMYLYEKAQINIRAIPEFVKQHERNLKFYPDKNYFVYSVKRNEVKDKQELLELVKKLLNEAKALLSLKK